MTFYLFFVFRCSNNNEFISQIVIERWTKKDTQWTPAQKGHLALEIPVAELSSEVTEIIKFRGRQDGTYDGDQKTHVIVYLMRWSGEKMGHMTTQRIFHKFDVSLNSLG